MSGGTALHAIRLLGSVVRGFASLDLAGGFDYSGPPSEKSRAYIAEALDTLPRARRPA